ncbi:hypothetical protein GRI44_11170 [Altererythrobacter confluentis]|uniref:Uncharacterized protein n=1 Tax=Allopontixanthobacter confluentis TaxID=1849021 RepID=A0A6L7GH81_9SPHN|nr:hypothetical protein [Allopontixanthobacter confluentis]MXP15309.1 hypothetical protein [Allopontixanthobacter confluentis]
MHNGGEFDETHKKKRKPMGLFKPDLYRNFAIGFALGAVIVASQIGPDMWQQIVPEAHAAVISVIDR